MSILGTIIGSIAANIGVYAIGLVSSHLSCDPQHSKNYIHNIPLEQDWYVNQTLPLCMKGWYPRVTTFLDGKGYVYFILTATVALEVFG